MRVGECIGKQYTVCLAGGQLNSVSPRTSEKKSIIEYKACIFINVTDNSIILYDHTGDCCLIDTPIATTSVSRYAAKQSKNILKRVYNSIEQIKYPSQSASDLKQQNSGSKTLVAIC